MKKIYCIINRVIVTGILTVLLLTASALSSHGQIITLKEKITVQLKNVTAEQVINELDKQTAYTFSYAHEQLGKIKISSFVANNIPLGQALEQLQHLAHLEFNLSGNTIAVKYDTPQAASPGPSSKSKPGTLTGIIRNEKNEVMPGVSIEVEQGQKGAYSTVTGDYQLTLSPGTYSLLISFVGYQKRRITGVVVKENEITDLSVTMVREDARQMQAVVVTGGAQKESVRSLLMAQKNNASMTTGISAEQIRLTPDNNTGQVLKRVSGITVQNNKFVTIRGVSDRYNNVLINGASLPSTEPNRRNFSFDVVPSAMVDNVVINKTATPDLPSEFTGGMVQINTKDVPTKNFLDITVGTGFNTVSSGKDMYSFQRDEKARLGRVDKERKWFGDGRLFDPALYITKVNREKDTVYRNAVGSRIPNRWQTYRYAYTPVQNYQLNGGMVKRFAKGNSLGWVGAVNYRNEQLTEAGESRVVQQSDFATQRYLYNTAIGALLNTAYKSKKHKFAWKNLYNHRYSNQYDEQLGAYISQGRYAKRRGGVTLTNQLFLTRLEGEHAIGNTGIKADWFGDWSRLIREQPDTRFVTGLSETQTNDPDYVFADDNKYRYNFTDALIVQNGLYSSRLEEKRKNTGANVSVPFTIAGARQLFKTGYVWSERKADFDGSGLKIRDVSGNNYTGTRLGLPYYEIVTPENFAQGKLEYTTAYARSETTGDRYTGKQNLQAWYGMLDLKMLQKLRLVGGFRYENNKMTLSTVFYNQQGYSEFRDTVYTDKSWLPSANLIFSATEKLNIRLAYSKTLARPDFVERSPYLYYDFLEMAEVVGQEGLKISEIKNYDLRFEYYPKGDELLSASLFYKKFDNPVERFYIIGSAVNAVQYRNLYNATAKGFEVEIRKSLDFINNTSKWLNKLFITGNYTWLKGEIGYIVNKSPFTQKDTFFVASGKRPIQGLSPYIINAGISYQDAVWGMSVSYNKFGRRIVNGGTNPALIQYENSRDVVDLQLSLRLPKQKAEIKFNVSDLLNQYYIIYCNNVNRLGNSFPIEKLNDDPKGDAFNEAYDFVNYKVKRGANFSITINYKL